MSNTAQEGKSKKIVPLKSFLGKPLELKTGNVYYENELSEAIKKYEAQFFSQSDSKGWYENFNQKELEYLEESILDIEAIHPDDMKDKDFDRLKRLVSLKTKILSLSSKAKEHSSETIGEIVASITPQDKERSKQKLSALLSSKEESKAGFSEEEVVEIVLAKHIKDFYPNPDPDGSDHDKNRDAILKFVQSLTPPTSKVEAKPETLELKGNKTYWDKSENICIVMGCSEKKVNSIYCQKHENDVY